MKTQETPPIGTKIKVTSCTNGEHRGRIGTVTEITVNGPAIVFDGSDDRSSLCFPYSYEVLTELEPTEAPTNPGHEHDTAARIALMQEAARFIIAAGASATHMVISRSIVDGGMDATLWSGYAESVLDWHMTKMEEISEMIDQA